MKFFFFLPHFFAEQSKCVHSLRRCRYIYGDHFYVLLLINSWEQFTIETLCDDLLYDCLQLRKVHRFKTIFISIRFNNYLESIAKCIYVEIFVRVSDFIMV